MSESAEPIYNFSPAFPRSTESLLGCDGLTKRELFAVMVLQGFLANSYPPRNVVGVAIDTADALIVELNSSEGHTP